MPPPLPPLIDFVGPWADDVDAVSLRRPPELELDPIAAAAAFDLTPVRIVGSDEGSFAMIDGDGFPLPLLPPVLLPPPPPPSPPLAQLGLRTGRSTIPSTPDPDPDDPDPTPITSVVASSSFVEASGVSRLVVVAILDDDDSGGCSSSGSDCSETTLTPSSSARPDVFIVGGDGGSRTVDDEAEPSSALTRPVIPSVR